MGRDVDIQLDDPSRRFRLGEPIHGTVRFSSDGETKCNGLEVELVLNAHGRGNSTSKTVESAQIYQGNLSPGSHEFPFELPTSGLPATYRGQYLNLDYQLEASVDVPLAFDPKTSVDIAINDEFPGRALRIVTRKSAVVRSGLFSLRPSF